MFSISRSFMLVYNAALGCVFALGIVGNLLVLAVVLTQKAAHTVINVYLVNLAVADILHLMSVPPLIHLSLVGSWPWGEAACTVYFLLYYINWTVSIFVIVAMGFDRYKAVVSPFSSERYRSHRFAAGLLVILWLLSALIMAPVGLCSHLYSVHSDALNATVNFCVHSSAEENGTLASGSPLRRFFLKPEHFSRYLFVVGCLLPALLLGGFYGLILRKLYRLRQARAASSGGPGGGSGGGGAAARFERVTLLVTAVVVFYLACSLPHWVHVNLVLSMDEPASWMAQTSHLTTLLSYIGSAGNPVLYAFLNDSFRTGLGGLLAQAGCSDGGGGGGGGGAGNGGNAAGFLGGRRNRGAGGAGNTGRGRGGEIFALRSANLRAGVTDPATSRRETEPLTATAATAATGAAAGAADDDFEGCLSDGLGDYVGMETTGPVLETAID